MRNLTPVGCMLGAVLLGGCLTSRSAPSAGGDAREEDCTVCHGDRQSFPGDNLRSAAPPEGVHLDTAHGPTATSVAGVGAHQSHLRAGAITVAVKCAECHVVPQKGGQLAADVPGHMDAAFDAAGNQRSAPTSFTGRAVLHDVVAAYDPATHTCTNYCHGATLTGGAAVRPDWTAAGAGEAQCGGCHGAPPPAPHPQNGACAKCHPTVDEALNIIDPEHHIDGAVDLVPAIAAGTCNACHGNAANAAPPVDTQGRSDTSLASVGAHQAHLQGSPIAAALPCTSCHTLPDPQHPFDHIDGVVELVWSDLARTGGATPTYDGATCSNYCHGQTLTGGSNPTPRWTVVDGSQAACGTCHGTPPSLPGHPQSNKCSVCHPTVDASGAIVQPDKHVDGKVDLISGTAACNSCHGSAANNAPPVDTQGRSDPSLPSVGAHQSHLAPDDGLAAAVACGECHVVPAAPNPYAHIDGAVTVTFGTLTGALATADGAAAIWDVSTSTCSNYCHGQTLSGGSNTTPRWTDLSGAQDACGTCHGLPPTAHGHPTSTRCVACHPDVDATGAISDAAQHINGQVDLNPTAACDACHGSAANNAPPVDTLGRAATTLMTVGAHQAHVTGAGGLSAPIPCTECHVPPTSATPTAHVDGTHGVLFNGPLATADSATASFNATTGTCQNYCHGGGATLVGLGGGASNTTPVWTVVNGTQARCGTCHALPPGGSHPANPRCASCHGSVVNNGLEIIDPTKHVNGHVDF
jgi:predicted CxxxxCH...CXXCH cytochrome family protein